MNAADRRRLTPVLGVLAGILVLLLFALWAGVGRSVHWHDRDDAAKLPPTGAAVPPPVIPPLAQFSAIWERPLFSQTRTPEAAGGGQSSGNLQLTGVVLLPDLKLAIVHDRTTGRDYRIVQDQPPGNGPALLELKPRSAVIDASGSRLQLQLIPGPSPQGGAEPGADDQAQAATKPDSGMVTPPEAADARAKSRVEHARALLNARIEAARRRAQQQQDGDDGG